MAYIDKDLMIKLFGSTELIQMTDRTNTGAIDDVVLGQAITQAEAEADSYIGSAYDLPLPAPVPSLPGFVADIARYYLYDAQPTELVQKRYDRAVSWLKDVAKGVVSLGYKPTDVQPNQSIVVVSARKQVFTDDLFAEQVNPNNMRVSGMPPWNKL